MKTKKFTDHQSNVANLIKILDLNLTNNRIAEVAAQGESLKGISDFLVGSIPAFDNTPEVIETQNGGLLTQRHGAALTNVARELLSYYLDKGFSLQTIPYTRVCMAFGDFADLDAVDFRTYLSGKNLIAKKSKNGKWWLINSQFIEKGKVK